MIVPYIHGHMEWRGIGNLKTFSSWSEGLVSPFLSIALQDKVEVGEFDHTGVYNVYYSRYDMCDIHCMLCMRAKIATPSILLILQVYCTPLWPGFTETTNRRGQFRADESKAKKHWLQFQIKFWEKLRLISDPTCILRWEGRRWKHCTGRLRRSPRRLGCTWCQR